MQIGSLNVTFHRTVRVAEGATPAALPPSLGVLPEYRVSDYPGAPAAWDQQGLFVGLHPGEAMWLAFRSGFVPIALTIGAGGINAITGELLTAELQEGGYLVTPPQPWLDGWKAKDGTVSQFVGTSFLGGEGKTVGEQLRGAECKSGGLGFAVFEPLEPQKLEQYGVPSHHALPLVGSSHLNLRRRGASHGGGAGGQSVNSSSGPVSDHVYGMAAAIPSAAAGLDPETCQRLYAPVANTRLHSSEPPVAEMGVGRGGKIVQKIYPDPHGIAAWRPEPVALASVYLVPADDFTRITGQVLPPPRTYRQAAGALAFKMADGTHADTPGSTLFEHLQPAEPAGGSGTPAPDTFPGGKGRRQRH